MIASRTTSILLIASLAACAGTSIDSHHYFHKEEKPHAAEWGYEGEIGPSHWGDLCPEYALAKTGRHQSPIDISSTQTQDLPPIDFRYGETEIDLVYNGHTIEEMENEKSSIDVAGKRYTLEQFHFHTPSEHTIDGRHAAMEMHLVHKAVSGDSAAVVAVMIEVGADNPAFAPVWDYLPTPANKERTASTTIDADALLPESRDYYHYVGSLTTPPCTEGVQWYLLKEPVQLSQAQIDRFRAILDHNNRPTQPLNGRQLTVTR